MGLGRGWDSTGTGLGRGWGGRRKGIGRLQPKDTILYCDTKRHEFVKTTLQSVADSRPAQIIIVPKEDHWVTDRKTHLILDPCSLLSPVIGP